MNILYCGDKTTTDGIMISVLSLLKQVKEPLHIVVLTMRFEDEDKIYEAIPEVFIQFLDELVKKTDASNFVTCVDMTSSFYKEFSKVTKYDGNVCYHMLKLYADQVSQIKDRVLYLNHDVICCRDCSEFYHQDMVCYEVAGALDRRMRYVISKYVGREVPLNSGVLLLNMNKIRQSNLLQTCRKWCIEKKRALPDQSALHKFAKNKKVLPRRYNEQSILYIDTVFRQFNSKWRVLPWPHKVTIKPWEVERLHEVLHVHAYDELAEMYIQTKKAYEKKEIDAK